MSYSVLHSCRPVFVIFLIEEGQGSDALSVLPRAVAVLRWGQGGTGPPNLAQPPKFLDTVVLLLVELIGSIVISLKFRLAVVAPQIFFF